MAPDEAKMQIREPEAPVVVRAENLVKKYGSRKALDDVSFELRQGEILGLLGPNGAGKTTAMRILTGFFPPNRGKVWIHGRDLFNNPRVVKRKIGYLPETVNLYLDMRVREFLSFVASVKGVSGRRRPKEVEDKLSLCGLWNVRHRLIGKLSKGYKQRVGLAQAMIGDPDVLILDEPTSGLDPKQIIEIRTLIRELGKQRTLILSTHILPEVSMVCDRVMIINQGKIIATGTTEELESGLAQKYEIFVVIGDPSKKETAMALLGGIPGIEGQRIVEEKPDQVCVALRISKGRDPRAEITKLFVHQDIPLLEVRASHLSLEDIFMKLVVDESSGRIQENP